MKSSRHLPGTSGLILLCACAFMATGCASVGPSTVARDRFDYNGEVARSWKEQTLLNIIKTRYADIPVFLDVAQIVSGYTLEGTVDLGGVNAQSNLADAVSVGAQGKWTDRPTITYTPLTGAQFNRNMLTPILPSAVLFTMQAGWPVNEVFRVAVRSINGIDSIGPDAERYERVITLLRALQQAQVMGMRVMAEPEEQEALVIFFRATVLTPEQQANLRELAQILGLDPGLAEFRVRFGATAANPGEIAMLTRSMLQILVDLGNSIDVPAVHLQEGRVLAGTTASRNAISRLRVGNGKERPQDALVAIAYHGGWFWIDDRDYESKRTFAMVMLLSTLTETGARESLPLVTIPAG